MTHTIILPLAVVLPRKTKKNKRIILNLNNYRNWSFFLSNDVKKKYCEVMQGQLQGLRIDVPIKLRFTLYRGNKHYGDRANVLCVQEKMFCDALTHYGVILDDNDGVILETVYRTGEMDKENPRVVCEIIEVVL